tara:strand:+ start:278 stop:499 length:222 start_codon:yes stop_codon:yes gene_type:complete
MNSKEKINTENIEEDSQNVEIEKPPIQDLDGYNFGWNNYSEITNGRFAMIGFLAIILIELLSKQSFLKWAGIL